jgi:hypothetical protein
MRRRDVRKEKGDRPTKQTKKRLRRTIFMKTFSPLCTALHQQFKKFFHVLHGHQSKTLSMFVMGAIRAESIVLPKVAEALLEESDAKTPSIERRLQRFLSNAKIDTEEVWDTFTETVLPSFQKDPIQLVIDLTSYEEHAQVVYIGIIQHSRVLPLAWKVMEGANEVGSRLMGDYRRIFQAFTPLYGKEGLYVDRR